MFLHSGVLLHLEGWLVSMHELLLCLVGGVPVVWLGGW